MTTCILLAGGLGTRLRGAVPGVPKCLAPVAGRPFLQVQLAQLASQGIEREFIEASSHGEDNPLIKTDDDVPEPRNRRVEIVVR